LRDLGKVWGLGFSRKKILKNLFPRPFAEFGV